MLHFTVRSSVVSCARFHWLIRKRFIMSNTKDPSSLSNTELWTTKNINLHLKANFDTRCLGGSATLLLSKTCKGNFDSVCLDTRDLSVSAVQCNSEAVDYKLHPTSGCFGEKLEIDVSRFGNKDELSLKIHYTTSPKCTALQWLSPSQTCGRKHPYMFSQCQAIHARSLLPCQDTPSVKASYTAQIEAPKDLETLMSAIRLRCEEPSNDFRTHHFEQKIPVPSYLIAIVIGHLESRKIGPRSHVWSEPEMVDEAAHEFSETEDMLKAGEELCGPYIWGIYDLLVLPPSFPYGGMENPCLTFVTPTLLAGDRSLSNVVAHEIAHSWTGNLVTNVTWEHFWLNEGHTVFVERKILKLLNGESGDSQRHLYMLGGRDSLKNEIKLRGDGCPLTALVPKLDGIDPDDAFSCVPYEKGSALLFYIESLVGEELVNQWLKAYVDHFKSQSIDTYQWKNFLYEFFKHKIDASLLDGIDWDKWFNQPGYLVNAPELDAKLATAAISLADSWIQHQDSAADPDGQIFKAFLPKQRMIFLDQLRQSGKITPETFSKLSAHYSLHESKNSEIRFRWMLLGLEIHCEDVVSPALTFLNQQGRMKFTRPLYRALNAWTEKRDATVENFKTQREYMHPITAQMVSTDLGL